jgi:hypothetical protein
MDFTLTLRTWSKIRSLEQCINLNFPSPLYSTPGPCTDYRAHSQLETLVEILIYGLIHFTSFHTVRGSRSSL